MDRARFVVAELERGGPALVQFLAGLAEIVRLDWGATLPGTPPDLAAPTEGTSLDDAARYGRTWRDFLEQVARSGVRQWFTACPRPVAIGYVLYCPGHRIPQPELARLVAWRGGAVPQAEHE